MTIQKVSKWKKIYFNNNGDQYFMNNGRRYHLSEFLRINDPEFHGQMTISNTCGLLIKLSPCCEAVKLAWVF